MDGWVLAAIAVVTTYVGYVLGVLATGRWIGRGGGGDDGAPDPPPSPGSDDFTLWEVEFSGVPARRA